jgi:beta-mannosidase
MATVFGEWRRAGSPCGGGIVLWLRDLEPGAGWGVLDSRGRPKAALGHLRRVLAPVTVWMTDEGQNGVAVHVANEMPALLDGRLRVVLYSGSRVVDEAGEGVRLEPRSVVERRVEGMLGRWVDASYAFRFGPPAVDVIVASLEDSGGGPLSQAIFFPSQRPPAETAEELGLTARWVPGAVEVSADRLVHGVRILAEGWEAEDDAFAVAPGAVRSVGLQSLEPGRAWEGGHVTAVNLRGSLRI